MLVLRHDVEHRAFDWVVQSVRSLSREALPPEHALPSTAERPLSPVLRDAGALAAVEGLEREEPDFSLPELQRWLEHFLHESRDAASRREVQGLRPFGTRSLLHAQGYGVQAARDAGLRLVTERARIEKMWVARVARDTHYDTLTVRVLGMALAHLKRDQDGQIIAGSLNRERRFSEYWTLVRLGPGAPRRIRKMHGVSGAVDVWRVPVEAPPHRTGCVLPGVGGRAWMRAPAHPAQLP